MDECPTATDRLECYMSDLTDTNEQGQNDKWVIGYWAIFTGIRQYWYWGIFFVVLTQYNTKQTAVSTIHMPVNDYSVPLLTCTLTAAVVCLNTMLISCCLLNTIIVIIIQFWDFLWSLLCYTLVLALVLISSEANIIRYWILGEFLGTVLTL